MATRTLNKWRRRGKQWKPVSVEAMREALAKVRPKEDDKDTNKEPVETVNVENLTTRPTRGIS